MDQGKPPAVFQQEGRGGAHLRQGTAQLHPGAAAAFSAACGEVGRIGDHQIEAPRRKLLPDPAQIAGPDDAGQAVFRQIAPGQRGGFPVQLHAGQVQGALPRQQQQGQRPRAAAQVAHPPAPPEGGEAPQQQGILPQRKASLPIRKGPQALHAAHVRSIPSSSPRTMRPVIPQMARPCHR